jgi:hypothetical protein
VLLFKIWHHSILDDPGWYRHSGLSNNTRLSSRSRDKCFCSEVQVEAKQGQCIDTCSMQNNHVPKALQYACEKGSCGSFRMTKKVPLDENPFPFVHCQFAIIDFCFSWSVIKKMRAISFHRDKKFEKLLSASARNSSERPSAVVYTRNFRGQQKIG